MSISLKKGQKISLTKESQGLTKLLVGLGWDAAERHKTGLFSKKPKAIDCDASAIMLKNGKLTDKNDVIYFGNLRHSTKAVIHMGDNLTGAGDGDDEQIIIDLSKIPLNYDKIVIVVNIYKAVERKQHFGMIKNAFIRLVNQDNNQQICDYNLTDNYDNMTAMFFAEVYRKGSEWKFNALGQGTKDASLSEILNRYV